MADSTGSDSRSFRVSFWRIALALAILAGLWDCIWVGRGVSLAGEHPLSRLEISLFGATLAAHATALAAFLLPGSRWLAGLLAACALVVGAAGFAYLYVLWPGAVLLLAAAVFASLSMDESPQPR